LVAQPSSNPAADAEVTHKNSRRVNPFFVECFIDLFPFFVFNKS